MHLRFIATPAILRKLSFPYRPFSIMKRYKECREIGSSIDASPPIKSESNATTVSPTKSKSSYSYKHPSSLYSVPEHVYKPRIPGQMLVRNSIQNEKQRVLRCTLVGLPNAGKSSIVNRLVNAPVSAVSKKINTTTKAIEGIFTVNSAQVILSDIPGIAALRCKKLPRQLLEVAWKTVMESDIILLVIDASRQFPRSIIDVIHRLCPKNDYEEQTSLFLPPTSHSTQLFQTSKSVQKPVLLLFNKMDQVKMKEQDRSFPIRAARVLELGRFNKIFELSAGACASPKLGSNVFSELKTYLASLALPGPWLYPDSLATSQSEASLVDQQIRSYLFNHTHQELPYTAECRIRSWKESKSSGVLTITYDIIVETSGMLKVVVGSEGANVKTLIETAQKNIEKVLAANGKERTVQLFVKVYAKKLTQKDKLAAENSHSK